MLGISERETNNLIKLAKSRAAHIMCNFFFASRQSRFLRQNCDSLQFVDSLCRSACWRLIHDDIETALPSNARTRVWNIPDYWAIARSSSCTHKKVKTSIFDKLSRSWIENKMKCLFMWSACGVARPPSCLVVNLELIGPTSDALKFRNTRGCWELDFNFFSRSRVRDRLRRLNCVCMLLRST